ncbi:hypothetical protein CASFOL_038465 [Castilleja foliolosa]|uniref:Uncharacterized protein n=1 Tax=Castilleja foliolosa TaxID=1961234 RepID=A0ABD3BLW3_9LAMI
MGGTIDAAKPIIEEEIAKKLDIDFSTYPNGPICIADFGCSTGGNSFPAIETITHAIKQKLESLLASSPPEFLVFFNDVVANDFNTLFGSLKPEKVYNAVGVPGDFHGRLLPRSLIHFAHSSWSLHWLTEAPRAVADCDSPAWNGGRIFYMKERKEVYDAYLDQFSRELGSFLEARAVEMVPGGMMAISNLSMPEFWNQETEYTVFTYLNMLDTCLMDMAQKVLPLKLLLTEACHPRSNLARHCTKIQIGCPGKFPPPVRERTCYAFGGCLKHPPKRRPFLLLLFFLYRPCFPVALLYCEGSPRHCCGVGFLRL